MSSGDNDIGAFMAAYGDLFFKKNQKKTTTPRREDLHAAASPRLSATFPRNVHFT